MAKPKPKHTTRAPAAAKRTHKPAPRRGAVATVEKVVTTTAPPSVELAAILPLLAAVAPLTDVQRSAFRSRYDDAQCLAMGGQTKAPVVLREAIGWGKTIQTTLASMPGAVATYSPARFAWYLECARDVALSLQNDDAAAGATSETKGASATARKAAMAAREALADKLAVLAGGVETEKHRLDDAVGVADTETLLVTSLAALGALANDWLARTDPESQALVASANLAQGDVDTANAAAGGLTSAASDAIGTRRSVKDSPATNLVEGRLLFEMKLAHAAFEAAHKRVPAVPRLPLGAATRRVIGGHQKSATTTPTGPAKTSTTATTTPSA